MRVKERPGFGQAHRRPSGAAIVASPVPASYDPDPDYFFHWYRDAAAIIEALRQAHEHGAIGEEAIGHLARLRRVSPSRSTGSNGREPRRQIRHGESACSRISSSSCDLTSELALIEGERVRMETRVNPDGTLDISRWPRPQYDGSAAIALTLMRWLADGSHRSTRRFGATSECCCSEELAFTLRHSRETCFDIWEEEDAHHYYTLRVPAAALRGAGRLARRRRRGRAAAPPRRDCMKRLDGFWLPDEGFIRSRIGTGGPLDARPRHRRHPRGQPCRGTGTAHSARAIRGCRRHSRGSAAIFAEDYPINPRDAAAPALGRYRGDAYFGGNPWYVATLAAAEFEYRSQRL